MMKNSHPSFTLHDSDAIYFARIPACSLRLLRLLHHEKMNYEEIAKDTGLAVGTVKSRTFRAREIIRGMRAEDAARNETWQQPLGSVYA